MSFVIRFLREGKISGTLYFLMGFPLLLLKEAVDRSLASTYHVRWEFWSYIAPLDSLTNLHSLTGIEREFLWKLAACAIPFVVIGVVLTLARLRAAGFPQWLVVLFFAPVLNIMFFLVLTGAGDADSVMEGRGTWVRAIPESKMGSATLAVLIASVACVLYTLLSVRFSGTYGVGLFIAAPFCVGMLASLVYGYRKHTKLWESLAVSAIAICIPGLMLLTFAIEGFWCLMMAAPLAVPLAMLGGLVGWAMLNHSSRQPRTAMLLIPLVFSPGVIGLEGLVHPEARVFRVRSTIEIAASRERVWREVIAFHKIPEPTEWLFHTGVAYPVRARIDGHGVGAVRRCEFSTGAFVEPITVWDEPKVLRFRVTENPPAMNEWSPYTHLETPHMRGYFGSEQGQFRLVSLPDGRTLLEGTTWYTDKVWPAAYWRVWSDYIIHRIHMRVLNNIKQIVEKG